MIFYEVKWQCVLLIAARENGMAGIGPQKMKKGRSGDASAGAAAVKGIVVCEGH